MMCIHLLNDVIHIFEVLENKMEGIIPEQTHEHTSVIDKIFDIKTEKQIIGKNGQKKEKALIQRQINHNLLANIVYDFKD